MPRRDNGKWRENFGRISQHYEPIQRESLKPFIVQQYKDARGAQITVLKPSPVLLECDSDCNRIYRGTRTRQAQC